MGPRAVYGQFLLDIARDNPNVVALSADLGRSSGLDRYSKELPEQFFNVGIAEQNLVGISAGLARSGLTPFASTFAPFASLRASEQVRMNMGYMQEPVNLVALASGFALGFLGNSHFGIEDVAVMRAIPGLTVISPADCVELYKCLHAMTEFQKPVYLRLTGGVGMPIVYSDEYNFSLTEAHILRPPRDVTILAHGTTVGHAVKACEALELKGHQVGLVNMRSIKPLDKDVLETILARSLQLLVFEEHSVIGGLGSAVLEHLNDIGCSSVKVKRFGVPDQFPKTGSYSFMLETLGLDEAGIENSVLESL